VRESSDNSFIPVTINFRRASKALRLPSTQIFDKVTEVIMLSERRGKVGTASSSHLSNYLKGGLTFDVGLTQGNHISQFPLTDYVSVVDSIATHQKLTQKEGVTRSAAVGRYD
jgi:hypothetical protein